MVVQSCIVQNKVLGSRKFLLRQEKHRKIYNWCLVRPDDKDVDQPKGTTGVWQYLFDDANGETKGYMHRISSKFKPLLQLAAVVLTYSTRKILILIDNTYLNSKFSFV